MSIIETIMLQVTIIPQTPITPVTTLIIIATMTLKLSTTGSISIIIIIILLQIIAKTALPTRIKLMKFMKFTLSTHLTSQMPMKFSLQMRATLSPIIIMLTDSTQVK